MNDVVDLTPELQSLIEQLGARDRTAARTAESALASRGEAGTHQDPSYKAAFDAQARERGIAEARTRKAF